MDESNNKKLGNSTNLTVGNKIFTGSHTAKKSLKATQENKNDNDKENLKSASKSRSNIQRHSSLTVTQNTVIRNNTSKLNIRSNVFGNNISNDLKNKTQNELDKQGDSGSSTISVGISAISASHMGIKALKRTYDLQNPNIKFILPKNKVTDKIHKSMRILLSSNRSSSSNPKIKVLKSSLNKSSINFIKGTNLHGNNVKKLSRNNVKTNSLNPRSFKIKKKKPKKKPNFRSKFNNVKPLKHTAKFNKSVSARVVSIAGNTTQNSDDMGIQSVGLGINASRYIVTSSKYTVDTLKYTPKFLKYSASNVKTVSKNLQLLNKSVKHKIRTASNTGHVISKPFQYTSNKSFAQIQKQTAKAIYKAGGSFANAVVQKGAVLAIKSLIPLLITTLVVIVMMNTISAPLSAISVIFGGSFTNKDSGVDFEVHSYLQQVVMSKRIQFIDELYNYCNNNLTSNGGQYHIVRLFTKTDLDQIEISKENISNSLYSNDELVSLIEPIFQTIIFSKYNLEPTQAEIDDLFNDIWDTLIYFTKEELPTEYCGDVDPECGEIHANIATCPNYIHGYHSSYANAVHCSSCCTPHVVNGEFYSFVYFTCNGYYYCQGHKILGVTINLDGYYELLAKYYTDPIDNLSNLSVLSKEQEEKLEALKDNYEICLNNMEIILQNANIGYGGSDISGVVFIDGIRPNNNELVTIAESNLGNIGGRLFWSWYGFRSRVEWCATFVSWCSNQLGYIDRNVVPKFCSTREGVKWFRNKGQWTDGSYREPVAGDIIFFDWDHDFVPNHVGIVVGNDGQFVYTIEGNSGDTCRRKSYPLSSSVILGYGLPNY